MKSKGGFTLLAARLWPCGSGTRHAWSRGLSFAILRASSPLRSFSSAAFRDHSGTPSPSSTLQAPTAAGLIIGDEILTGKVLDTNTQFLAKLMFERGIKLRCVEVVRDDVPQIVEALARLMEQAELVFTSGGIGPTHDDVTYEAVAQAFGTPLAHHEETLRRMREWYQPRNVALNESRKRMALLPVGAKILYTPPLWVPLVVMKERCWVLPGVPQLYTRILEHHKDLLPQGMKLHRSIIGTKMTEGDIAEALIFVQNKYPEVSIGSYPQWQNPELSVRVTLESTSVESLAKASSLVQEKVAGFVLPVE
ncbi:3'-phosphoadenosine 5'-phosphosulfate sulfotransferase (PAPS reductase) [Balamuthia mandrillaris]